MKKYKIAAILMIIHGGFIELGGILGMKMCIRDRHIVVVLC